MPDRPALARTQTTRPCKLCNNLDPRSHPATYHDQESTTRSIASLTLQLDPVRLKRSHENCPRCRLLADALDAHFESWRKTKPRLLLELVECAPVRLEVQRDGIEGVKIEIYAPPAIEDCLKNHQHRLCGQSRRDLFVPSRLIYVGKDPGSTEHIKLCQVPANKVKYISLSHCWGNGPTFTTTAANLAERKRHIDFDSMPQSFQDAVTITQELGVRYLWIDALCILQDSKEDWETESAKMSSIYENAYITIAATAAHNSDCGILSPRPRPAKLTYQPSPRSKPHSLRARLVPSHHPSTTTAPPPPPSGPLRHRAWALQEHVLTSRILHYTRHELLFECRILTRCECRRALAPARPTPHPTVPGLLPTLLTTARPRAHRAVWHRLVAQYTARRLTVPADKLPAFGGIARAFAALRGGGGAAAYVAGCWAGADALCADLLWSTTGNALPAPPWRAPSFSWASVDAAVGYAWAAGGADEDADDVDGGARLAPLAAVREARAVPAGRNPLGAVADAWVALEGPVVADAVMVAEEEAGGMGYCLRRGGGGGGAVVEVVPDALLVAVGAEVAVGVRRAGPGEEADARTPFEAPVLCLGLARCEGSWIAGVVLARAAGGERGGGRRGQRGRGGEASLGCYERLGTFSCGDEWFAGAERRELVLV
ncbi:hypothetical protein GTA08_BOTSDO08107 [Neofusicoccum parvum]|uniref:Uncharacterized protein n=1 Tax=Neofusicoccum parvum TaxID=310453 RepID=A0ACB5SMA0_9PEZI|nr:hypothetical protein GTA08_BOTSDO08107 [Neofusicoccum parvum]